MNCEKQKSYIYLAFSLFFSLSVYVSVFLSFSLSLFQSMFLSFSLSFRLSIFVSVAVSTLLSFYPSLFLSNGDLTFVRLYFSRRRTVGRGGAPSRPGPSRLNNERCCHCHCLCHSSNKVTISLNIHFNYSLAQWSSLRKYVNLINVF